jgi:hypoxanthine-guanine phosphoribosyltransferase
MTGHANHVAFGHVIALGDLQAVVVDGQVLLVADIIVQGVPTRSVGTIISKKKPAFAGNAVHLSI